MGSRLKPTRILTNRKNRSGSNQRESLQIEKIEADETDETDETDRVMKSHPQNK